MNAGRNRIGIVDDDPAVCKALSRMLRLAGFNVITFSSPIALLSEKAFETIDLLILDVRMPGINGLELRDRLLASGYDPPVIFMTAYENGDQKQKALAEGVVTFLKKPFDEKDLLDAIAKGLGRK